MIRSPKNYRLHPFKSFRFADVQSKPVSTYTKQEKYAESHVNRRSTLKVTKCTGLEIKKTNADYSQIFVCRNNLTKQNKQKNTTVIHKYC
jgi:hypothetical protein